MKIFVTGHRGFIGQNLLNYLSSYDITGFDIADKYIRPKQLNIEKYDWVIHLGAASSTTETDVQKVMDLNVSWPIELFEECVNQGVNFQWSSSASVYGKVTTFKVTQHMRPANLYARSKMLLENYITTRNASNVWQGFRYFNVYGDHEAHKKTQASPYHQFTEQAKETGKIRLFVGSDDYKRDFIHVDTVCDYHEKFMSKKVCGIFNIGTGIAKSFNEIAFEIANKYDATIEYIEMPKSLKTHYQSYTCADMTFTNMIIGKK
jgi:ADP-L-glycero-D-manno-heptose 6-epimerase